MNNLDKILQEMVNFSYEEIRKEAMKLARECVDGFDALGIEGVRGIDFVEKFLANTVAVNGYFSSNERRLINDLFKKPERIDKIAINTTSKDIKDFDQLVSALPIDLKTNYCLLAAYVLSADEHIDTEEYKYLLSLLD